MLSDSLSKHVTFAVVKTHSTQYILPASLQITKDYCHSQSVYMEFLSQILAIRNGLY